MKTKCKLEYRTKRTSHDVDVDSIEETLSHLKKLDAVLSLIYFKITLVDCGTIYREWANGTGVITIENQSVDKLYACYGLGTKQSS